MKIKVKKVESHFPPWIKVGEEYDCKYDGHIGWYKIFHEEKVFVINESYFEIIEDEKGSHDPLIISIPEPQLQAFRKAAILAKEYCQEALVEHEKKVGRSILRKEIILEDGLKKDLEFLEGVVECFEEIFPEEYF